MNDDKKAGIAVASVVGVFVLLGILNWYYSRYRPGELQNILSGSALVILLVILVYSKHSAKLKKK
jgi:hypothetical protein